MIPLVMETILEHIQRKPFPWVDDQPTEDDLDHILKQTADSFDRLKLKDSMIDDLRKGKVTLVTKSGPYAKVLALVYPSTQIPWEAFGVHRHSSAIFSRTRILRRRSLWGDQ